MMSYTYAKKGARWEDPAEIFRPIDNKVYFAGEHTKIEFIGAAHNAYISGIEAAERIIKDNERN